MSEGVVPELDFPESLVGDTFQGAEISLQDTDENPIALTGATLKWAFRKWSPHGKVAWTLELGDGLTLSNSDQTLLIDPWTPPAEEATYHHDLQAVWPSGWTQTLLAGQWPFCKDVTP